MAKNAETGDVRVVSLTLPAQAKWLALCRLVLSGLCQVNSVDDETVADLKLAVTEACSNSVRHAYAEGASGMVTIRYELRGGSLSVEVADAGHGFAFDRPLAPLGPQPDEDLREDEMGLAIISALVDQLDIGAGSNGRGTRIAFSKNLARGE
jgi:serine/threonine-protein kinase RsbW